jgi:hypothetical protein
LRFQFYKGHEKEPHAQVWITLGKAFTDLGRAGFDQAVSPPEGAVAALAPAPDALARESSTSSARGQAEQRPARRDRHPHSLPRVAALQLPAEDPRPLVRGQRDQPPGDGELQPIGERMLVVAA